MINQLPGGSTDAPLTGDSEKLRCRGCGGVHPGARLVDLPDGRVVGNYSEEFFLHYEARFVLKKYRSKRTRLAYLDSVEEKRGKAARVALRQEMMVIWEHRQQK